MTVVIKLGTVETREQYWNKQVQYIMHRHLRNAVLTEPEEVLTEQSISLYPNGEEAEQVITLNGMMPEGAARRNPG